jgi:hypothetical protein
MVDIDNYFQLCKCKEYKLYIIHESLYYTDLYRQTLNDDCPIPEILSKTSLRNSTHILCYLDSYIGLLSCKTVIADHLNDLANNEYNIIRYTSKIKQFNFKNVLYIGLLLNRNTYINTHNICKNIAQYLNYNV